MNVFEELVVSGSGQAESLRPDLFDAQIRAKVRYADPAAWITAAAVAQAVSESKAQLSALSHEAGIVVVSDQGPASTMTEVQVAAVAGFSSPLRYAASNPGSLAGVSCIAFGFHGPTLFLGMLPCDGVPVALELCACWLTRGAARCMVLATFRSIGPAAGSGRAVLLTHPDLLDFGSPLTQSVTDWLSQVTD